MTMNLPGKKNRLIIGNENKLKNETGFLSTEEGSSVSIFFSPLCFN